VRVIHTIHGVDGRIGRAGNVGYTSILCDIIKEIDRLASPGIDLISMMHKKIGNGLNTSFWEDRWRGEQRLKEVFLRIYALEGLHLVGCDMALDSFDEWISWITNLRLPSKHKSILEGVCYGLWWFIWALRNKKIFGVVPSSKDKQNPPLNGPLHSQQVIGYPSS
nr:RNA-directed DNA polymerase, eukaryota, reverse transcriptase zinc-binding domain protein [Tanacetum cinerariifolium]GFA57240.1 RNA-directed DNA polymerase, eukaryota, reverse transcriptase zinc-binding domain protein [Tanacetum cinerariifolium]